MVTGDNIDTAIAIAKQCGILRPGIDLDADGELIHPNVAMAGPDFRKKVLDPHSNNIDQAAFDQIWPYLRVLARSSPTDKYLTPHFHEFRHRVSGGVALVSFGPVFNRWVSSSRVSDAVMGGARSGSRARRSGPVANFNICHSRDNVARCLS